MTGAEPPDESISAGARQVSDLLQQATAKVAAVTPIRIPIEEATCPWCGGEVCWAVTAEAGDTGSAWCAGSSMETVRPGVTAARCPANWRIGTVERAPDGVNVLLVLEDPRDIIVFRLRREIKRG